MGKSFSLLCLVTFDWMSDIVNFASLVLDSFIVHFQFHLQPSEGIWK